MGKCLKVIILKKSVAMFSLIHTAGYLQVVYINEV